MKQSNSKMAMPPAKGDKKASKSSASTKMKMGPKMNMKGNK